MTDAASQRVREFRFGLYARAHAVLGTGVGVEGVQHLVCEADRCKRACEAIELAEFHVAFKIPQRGPEHFVRQLQRCPDCVRDRCVGEE